MSVCQRRLVYLLYGGQAEYRWEAKYSLLSLLRQTPREELPQIIVYTDRPEDFCGWPVDLEVLDDDRLKQWRGSQGYMHRLKAAVMHDAFNLPGASVFIDTDTFFVGSASRLFERLEKADWLVDEVEARWDDWRGERLHDAAAEVLEREYQIKGDMPLINSGVLALRKEPVACMDLAIRLIDEIYPLAPDVHVVEQFAVGCAAYIRRLGAPANAQGIVNHYYGDKLFWRLMIAEFFSIHGEEFSERLVAVSAELPSQRPKPSLLKRLMFRLLAIGLDKQARKGARAAFFALEVPGDRYSRSCAPAYALDCLNALKAEGGEQDLPSSWRKCLTAPQVQRLGDLLEQARKLY
ncbi:hypothetical protein ACWKWZ_18775 [Metapseudomonas otitidis]|jgi:hypothetical protein